jgi:hypothetical protein
VLDLSNDFGRLVFEQAQGELVAAKPCAHLTGSTTFPNERAETSEKSIDLRVAVSVVERLEIVHVEEHERDPLLSGEGRKRGPEFSLVCQSGQTIHSSIVGGVERRRPRLDRCSGMTPEEPLGSCGLPGLPRSR